METDLHAGKERYKENQTRSHLGHSSKKDSQGGLSCGMGLRGGKKAYLLLLRFNSERFTQKIKKGKGGSTITNVQKQVRLRGSNGLYAPHTGLTVGRNRQRTKNPVEIVSTPKVGGAARMTVAPARGGQSSCVSKPHNGLERTPGNP